MYRNQIRIALRCLVRNRVFSLINISGLAVGMAAFFAIMQYVYFERSYDKFHKNAGDIYRVTLRYGKNTMATNNPATGAAMKADFPEVLEYTRAAPLSLFTNSITLSTTDDNGNRKSFSEEGIYLVDSTFLTFFSFPVINGNPANPFPNQNSIVITNSLAEKFFGKENPVGKELYINDFQPLLVSAVIEDVPENYSPVNFFDPNL